MLKYKYYNNNPTHRKHTPDCYVRAIALATNRTYEYTILKLATLQCLYGYDVGDSRLHNIYLKSLGWKKTKSPTTNNPIIIAHIVPDHLTTIIGNTIYDTWDCRNYPIDYYYIKGDKK